MSKDVFAIFGPRSDRFLDQEAVETFPWPVVAGYDEIHRFMDSGLAVHAAWQVRDAWENLLKFLCVLAVADHLATEPTGERCRQLLARLLAGRPLSLGHWATLLQIAYQEPPAAGKSAGKIDGLPLPPVPPTVRLGSLADVLFKQGRLKFNTLVAFFAGDKPHTGLIAWRNSWFGHGVFVHSEAAWAELARTWLDHLHEAFDELRDFFTSVTLLLGEGSDGALGLAAERESMFYHKHKPPPAGDSLEPARLLLPGGPPLDLHPWLSVQRCAICGRLAFFFDEYRRAEAKDGKKGQARFRDFRENRHHGRDDLEQLADWARCNPSHVDARDDAEPREPDPRRFRNFDAEFQPSTYLARQVADFIKTHDCGVLHLCGEGGVGKSWVCRGLERADMLRAFLDDHRIVRALHATFHGTRAPSAGDVKTILREQAKANGWAVPAEPDAPSPDHGFAAWLGAVMRANGWGEVLVTFDGLDELPADSDVPSLIPPADVLPQGCYLLLASRPDMRAAAATGLARARGEGKRFTRIAADHTTPEHRAVLLAYAVSQLAAPRPDLGALPAGWAEPLVELCGGSFLYLFHYCRALRFGGYTDPSRLPAPDEFYPAFFDHLRARVGDALFETIYARTLALIAVAREPIGVSHLAAFGLRPDRLPIVLDDLADLLSVRRFPWDREPLYVLGHDVIKNYLNHDRAWHERLTNAHRHLAQTAWNQFHEDWSQLDPFDPIESYLVFHVLEHSKMDPPLTARVYSDSGLANACVAHAGHLYKRCYLEQALVAYNVSKSVREYQVQDLARSELRADLASVYMNRGVTLGGLGRLEEALAEYGPCAALWETLVEREGRRELRADLALVYLNRGNALWGLGRLEEALAEYGRCAAFWETLVEREGRRELRADLASVYMNRGVTLGGLGRLEEALAEYGRCAALRETLVEHEGRRELRADLASVYMNRGNALWGLGRLEEALAEHGRCAALRETLVEHEGRRELRADLATVYMNRGVTLGDLGRLEEALAEYGRCAALRETLVEHEGRRELRADLASVYMNRGNTLGDLGRLEEALAEHGRCAALRETLVEHEGRRELRAGLASVYNNRGNALSHLGRLEEALAEYGRCAALRETLVEHEGRRELRADLATVYMNRGVTLGDLGRLEEALAEYGRCAALRETLVEHEGRRELRADLASVYMNRGNTLGDLGRLEEALAEHGRCAALRETLVEHEGRRELRAGLASVYNNRGNALSHLGRLEEALAEYGRCAALRETLVEHEGRRELRADLASVYMNRGITLRALVRLEEARAEYDGSLSIYRQLLEREGRDELRPEVVKVLCCQCTLYLKQEKREAACAVVTEALSLLEPVMAARPRPDLKSLIERCKGLQQRACGAG